MNCGPRTFQCACLHSVCRSMTSARRAFRRRTTSVRVVSGRSFLVLRSVSSPSSEARLRLGSGAGADIFAPRLRVVVAIGPPQNLENGRVPTRRWVGENGDCDDLFLQL